MNVNNIRLINFRNYNSINVNFNKNINIFIGKNAQGKTNLLEAIYMCSTGKSFRTNKDKDIINFQKKEAYIGADILIGNFNKFIELKLDREMPKIIRVNKNELKNQRELFSGLSMVVFNPDDLKIVKNGPQERRIFIDQGISQLKPVYNHNLGRYLNVLYQRSKILKSSRFKRDLSLLDVFDVQLSKIGTGIIMERQAFIKELTELCRKVHYNLTHGKELIDIKYMSNIPLIDSKQEMEKKYLKLLKDSNIRDLECGNTEIGPHRDDIQILIDGMDVRNFGSQGQQRTTVLTLKLAEVELIKKDRGSYPVVLLDDVFSELDEERRSYLTRSFSQMQTFITITDAIDIKSLENMDKNIYNIENGKLERRG